MEEPLMFKRRVIIVDDCPFCSSPKTGYIIASTKTDPRICRRYLRYGEYVRLQQYANDDRNCFCLDCNAEWHQKLYSKKLSFIELWSRILLNGNHSESGSQHSTQRQHRGKNTARRAGRETE